VITILPDTPTSAPLKTWIHGAQCEGKQNALISEWWWESLDGEDDEEENQQTESQIETPTTYNVTSHEEEQTTNVFIFSESERTYRR
jgi:hypothetical protein